MWAYMVTCYGMSFLTSILLLISFFQSFLKFSVFQANHLTFMIFTCIAYLFTETLIIFFFVGTGMDIKESVLHHQMDPQFHRRSIAIKRKVFPPLVCNLVLMMMLFILVGAVDTHRFPLWAYALTFLGCLFHFGKTKWIQNEGFRETSKISMDMAAVRRGR